MNAQRIRGRRRKRPAASTTRASASAKREDDVEAAVLHPQPFVAFVPLAVLPPSTLGVLVFPA
ncbi:MAG TPA: hypothetical protein VHU80_20505, partial [Polyangiaceae bacterium]|nr:hypothetical protein [Polyangiaceae bacterium]